MIVTDNTPSRPGLTPALEARWRRLGVHRASRTALPDTWSTGWPRLDALLPGGGYPLAAVTEFLIQQSGQGELSLLLAALRPRLNAHPDQRLVFVEPPNRLNAPALDAAGIDRARVPVICCRDTAERIWTIKQLAAAGGFVAFVLWDDGLDMAALRQLQLASETAGSPVFVYRNLACARQRSPAALRLAVTCHEGRQHIEILKCRGPAGARTTGLAAGRNQPWRDAARASPVSHIGIQAAENEADPNTPQFQQTAPDPSDSTADAPRTDHEPGSPGALSSNKASRYANGG